MTTDAYPARDSMLTGPEQIVLRAATWKGPFSRSADSLLLKPVSVHLLNVADTPVVSPIFRFDPMRTEARETVIPGLLSVSSSAAPVAPGESLELTVSGRVPARPGLYRSALRVCLPNAPVMVVPVELRVAAASLWAFCCMLLGLVAAGLGSVMDSESTTRRQLGEALQLRQEIHENVEQVPAALATKLPMADFDREVDGAIALLGQHRPWSFVDRRVSEAKQHLEAARQTAEKLRSASNVRALGDADYNELVRQWSELREMFDTVSKQFSGTPPVGDSFAARLDAFDAWTVQRLLTPMLGYLGNVFPYNVARVRLLYLAGRGEEANALAETTRRGMRRSADYVREQVEQLAFFREAAALNLATEQRLRRRLSSNLVSTDRRATLERALDEATALLRPPFDWSERRLLNQRIEKLATDVALAEQESSLAAVARARDREEAEDSIAEIQPVLDQGASLPRGVDGKIEPEAKFAWLQRLVGAWKDRLAHFPEPNPPELSGPLSALEQAVNVRDLDQINARQRALLEAWQVYSTERALKAIAQALAPYCLSMREDILSSLGSVQEELRVLGSHPQQAAWENQMEALRMQATGLPDSAERMNKDTFAELCDLSGSVFALSNEVASAHWDRAALSAASKQWLATELRASLTPATLKNLLAELRPLEIKSLSFAGAQYEGRELRFQLLNLDPAWKNGVELTFDFGDGAVQTLNAEEHMLGRAFAHTYVRRGSYTLSAFARSCAETASPTDVRKLGVAPPQPLEIGVSPIASAEFWADAFFNLRYGIALLFSVGLYFWRFETRAAVFGANLLDYAQAFALAFAASAAANAPNAIAGLFP